MLIGYEIYESIKNNFYSLQIIMVFEKIMPQVDGALSVWEQEEDYLLGSIISEIETAPVNKLILPQVNQGTALNGELTHFCTGINPFRIVMGLDGKETMDMWLLRAFREYCKEKAWYRQWIWNHTQVWARMTKRFFEEELKKNFLFFRTMIGSKDYMIAKKKNYASLVTYRGNAAYNADYRADGMLDGVNFGSPTYGHATVHTFNELVAARIDDSYYGTTFNNYGLRNLIGLVQNAVYYKPCYIFVPDPKNVLKDAVTKYQEEIIKATAWVKREWLSNGLNPDDAVLRKEFRVTLRRQAGRP